jgi:outer membrane protein assembly factor BamB
MGPVWSFQSTDGDFTGTPVVADGTLVAAAGGGTVYALDASTGHPRWAYTTAYSDLNGNAVDSSPAVVNGVVYVGSGDGETYALDASTGDKLWSYNLNAFSSIWASRAVANGEVYVSAPGKLSEKVYAFDLAAELNAVARPTASRLKPNRSLRPSN